MVRVMKIGLVGLGTVGSGVVHLLKRNRDVIIRKTGIDLQIVIACDLKINEMKHNIPNIECTTNWHEVVTHPNIDTVVELIGGIEPAFRIITESLKAGKHVVTANKKLLAERGKEIFHAANEAGKTIGFEASVGGGIPCIRALNEGLVGNRIASISGILNGTTNYILTLMEEENKSFSDALRDAQEKGFAEADPTFDIEGHDAAHKICVISTLAYGKWINFSHIPIQGISQISPLDIHFAHEMGYAIKLLGISKLVGDEIDIRVHPAMIHRSHPLASVRRENNAITIAGDMTGEVTLHGKGAGSTPTASAVVSDLVQIARGNISLPDTKSFTDTNYLSSEKRITRYYLRLFTIDRPGILAKIAGAFGKYDVSIASVIQKESNTDYVPVLFMTHRAVENKILAAIKEINSFDFVDGKVTLIPVEDSIAK
ncbi:MAG: homoserine dehydrogenase [Spirochaetes bacterium]|nr:homoserine dehydrogenase [Spirochaetota bacterium]